MLGDGKVCLKYTLVLYAVVVGHLGMEHMKDVTNIPIVSSYELPSQEAC